MATQSQKQQIIQQIKDSTNILVAVSTNPSVDELSGALGLTIFLNELGKHATAVFSGKMPPAISFLEPGKTFEDTADSLRDFIIALDKEKADHLRYKVVDDAVKIFITPYKTTISEADLEFSQGDYNVELVLALNVEDNDHLDTALSAHGRILHDATVVTITAGDIKSNLGVVDWHDGKASSVSEMLVELIDGLKTAKVALSEQSATALLTGIVAATDRFSNELTSSRVMTSAAELMAAGANQQLIAVKLSEPQEEVNDIAPQSDVVEPVVSAQEPEESDDATVFKVAKKVTKNEDVKTDDGALEISHVPKGDLDEVARKTRSEQQDAAARVAEAKLHKIQAVKPEQAESSAKVATEPMEAPQAEPEPVIPETPVAPAPVVAMPMQGTNMPSFGGTLNATTEQAAEDKRREEASDKNKMILKHGGYVGSSQPAFGDTPLNAAMSKETDEPPAVDLFAAMPPQEAGINNGSISSQSKKTIEPPTPSGTVMEALAEDTHALMTDSPHPAAAEESLPLAAPASASDSAPANDSAQAALAAVNAAIDNATPAPLPPAPSFPSAPTLAEIEHNVAIGELPPLPPLPDFSTLPPLPPAPIGVNTGEMPPLPTAPTDNSSAPFNPSQFQIPGQQ